MMAAPFDELAGLATAALRDCALLPTDHVDESGELVGEILHAVVEAQGMPAAQLSLSAPRQLAQLIAVGMLGDAPAATDEPGASPDVALLELANVLGRRLITHFFGESHQVGVPTLQQTPPAFEPDAATCSVILVTESGHPLRIDWVTRCARP
jgi:hypothetical protein